MSAVGRGAAAGLLVAVPALVAGLASDQSEPPTWVVAGYLVLMAAAFALAGLVAGTRRTDTPMLHGGAAALVVFAVVELAALPRLVGGDGVAWGAVAVLALVAAAEGVAFGLLAEWRHRHRRRRSGTTLDGLGESAG